MYSSITRNSQKVETTKEPSTAGWMSRKQNIGNRSEDPQEVKIGLPDNPVIPPLGVDPEKVKTLIFIKGFQGPAWGP